MAVIVTAVLAYLLGCCNTSIVISKYVLRDDVRNHGSGNAGLTNFYRTYGAKYALGVILFDMGKTVIACLIGGAAFDYLAGDWTLGILLGGLGCVLGHMFPVFFGFKGGKGVSVCAAIICAIDWRAAAAAYAGFAIAVLLSRRVSLGSITAAAVLVAAALCIPLGTPKLLLSLFCSAIVIIRHRENIARLIKGTEPKFSAKK